jgi:hypothetical protein
MGHGALLAHPLQVRSWRTRRGDYGAAEKRGSRGPGFPTHFARCFLKCSGKDGPSEARWLLYKSLLHGAKAQGNAGCQPGAGCAALNGKPFQIGTFAPSAVNLAENFTPPTGNSSK